MMLSTGIGAEVQRPLATVIVFSMACDTFPTMLALPVLYLLFGKGPLPSTGPDTEGRRGMIPGNDVRRLQDETSREFQPVETGS